MTLVNKLLPMLRMAAIVVFVLPGMEAQQSQRAGVLYEAASKGEGSALKELTALAQSGDSAAQVNLGLMYAFGEGVPRDYDQAVAWYRKSAEQGEVLAEANLGIVYSNGQGVAKDAAVAARWFRLAAEKGDSQSQFNLGLMYVKGEGVLKDAVIAEGWMRKAAEQGLARAQFFVAIEYSKSGDSVHAYLWANLAAAQGIEEAGAFRTELEVSMTPVQIAEAQKLSREWKPGSVNDPREPAVAAAISGPVQSSTVQPSVPKPSACAAPQSIFQNGNEVKQIACFSPDLMFIIPVHPIQPAAYWIGVRNLSRESIEIDPARWHLLWFSKDGARHESKLVNPVLAGVLISGNALGRSTVFPNGSAGGVVYFGGMRSDFAVLVLSYRSRSAGEITVQVDVSGKPTFKH